MATPDDLAVLAFTSREEWRAWLDDNHADVPGVHVKLAKKHSGKVSVSLDDAQEVALCYGWIDSLAGRIDDDWWRVKFTPRRPGGNWSALNRERVARLVASGEMQPAGQREVDAAKADGRWG